MVMLDQILTGETVEDTIAAFKWREKEGRKYNKKRANFFQMLIDKLKKKNVEWEAKEVNKAM